MAAVFRRHLSGIWLIASAVFANVDSLLAWMQAIGYYYIQGQKGSKKMRFKGDSHALQHAPVTCHANNRAWSDYDGSCFLPRVIKGH